MIAALLSASSPPNAHAGALVTKTGQAEVGNLLENPSGVSLQSEYGAVEHKKDQLLWFNTSREVDTLFKAGTLARSENNLQAAAILFEQSAAREPSSNSQAKIEWAAVKEALASQQQTKVEQTASKVEPPPGDAMTPGEKVERGRKLIENGKTMLGQRRIDSTADAAAADTAKKNIAEGEKLLAEGEKELEEQRAREAVINAKKQEIREAGVASAKESLAATSTWTREEILANIALAAIFGLVVLLALWHITMKEPKTN
ncbi:MAG: hypothetical protein PHV34_11145 [Verrucomicrobiae bacterium]|nr:hypothetical protein [Verrucomicrobiae bacterium]